jgi:protein involved in polysaccharide export with SLBB domain
MYPKIFGADVFRNSRSLSQGNINVATPKNYVIGAGDELVIDIWGQSQNTYNATVNPEGYIRLEVVGLIAVKGLSLADATQRIRNKFSNYYSGLRGTNPSTYLNVSVGNVRSVFVTMSGFVTQPGIYALPSFSSVYNALAVAGGPNNNGTFRKITVTRNQKVIAEVDIYPYLTQGLKQNDIILQDGDIVYVGPYVNRVKVDGELKKTGYFELVEGESLADLLLYAGGFTPNAYQENITLIKLEGKSKVALDVPKSGFATTLLGNGDEVSVGGMIENFKNVVFVSGAVYHPGAFAVENNPTLADLLKNAGGILDNAYTGRATIFGRDKYLQRTSRTINLKAVIAGEENYPIMNYDSLVVYNKKDLEINDSIVVAGYVKRGGEFPFYTGLTLADAILMAGGFTEGYSKFNIEISRIDSSKDEIVSVKAVDLLQGTEYTAQNISIRQGDRIFVKQDPNFMQRESITLIGEILFPGTYPIDSRRDRISDLIERSGGLTEGAYARGAYLIRTRSLNSIERENRINQLKKQAREIKRDSIPSQEIINEILDVKEQVGIDLKKAINNKGSKYDLLLHDGDEIRVPVELETVKVSGEVLYPVSIRHRRGRSAKYYVKSAGGFSGAGIRKGTYVIYANGSVKSTSTYLLVFNNFPKVTPGAEVVVPIRKQKDSNVQQTLAVSSALASISLTVVTLVNLLTR